MSDIKTPSCVLALGFFDGVHSGHAALLRTAVRRAGELGIEPAVMTFDTHPDTLVLRQPVPLITSAPDRAYLIRELFGIERVEFLSFTEETMQIPWRDFLDRLCADMQVRHFVVGFDFRFGWKGEGDPEKLRAYCLEKGLGCDIIPPVTLDGITVSSTHIRTLLQDGRICEAARFLGHPHILGDLVRHGHQIGRKLGTPTINMRFSENVLILPLGVYASRVRLSGQTYSAVTNIGTRPTFTDSPEITVESFLLDYHGSLYGRSVVLEFHEYLRPERKFLSAEDLSGQISKDIARAKLILEDHP